MLEHSAHTWHATDGCGDVERAAEHSLNVLEHSAHTWHATCVSKGEPVLEHIELHVNSFLLNKLHDDSLLAEGLASTWHATRETQGDVLEHGACMWHATTSAPGQNVLEHSVSACHRGCFHIELRRA